MQQRFDDWRTKTVHMVASCPGAEAFDRATKRLIGVLYEPKGRTQPIACFLIGKADERLSNYAFDESNALGMDYAGHLRPFDDPLCVQVPVSDLTFYTPPPPTSLGSMFRTFIQGKSDVHDLLGKSPIFTTVDDRRGDAFDKAAKRFVGVKGQSVVFGSDEPIPGFERQAVPWESDPGDGDQDDGDGRGFRLRTAIPFDELVFLGRGD